MTNEQENILESLNWRIHECKDGTIEIENYSPKGENIIFTIDKNKNLLNEIWEIYQDFDIDEHVELWIAGRGKNGVPESIIELVRDAKDIESMLKELFFALMCSDINKTEKIRKEKQIC